MDSPYAYGSYGHNEIHLASDDPAVFFHELAHKAHEKLESLKGGQDPVQEAVAELAAATLARIYAYPADNHAWNYLAHYAGGRTPMAVGRLCYSVLAKTEKILSLILEEAKPTLFGGENMGDGGFPFWR